MKHGVYVRYDCFNPAIGLPHSNKRFSIYLLSRVFNSVIV